MFSELKRFVEVLAKVLPFAYRSYQGKQRKEVLLELQESFFILKDLIATGEELLSLAGADPALKISTISSEKLEQHYFLCQVQLNVQCRRLERLGAIFLSKPFLDFEDPSLRDELDAAIAAKGSGYEHRGLYSIGSALFFHFMFGRARYENEPQAEFEQRISAEQAELMRSLYADEANVIDLDRQRVLLEELQELHARLGQTINALCTPEERMNLAPQAQARAREYAVLPMPPQDA